MSDTTETILQNKRILVTGGAGFIGSHIVDAVRSENEVIVFDNLSTGSTDRVPPDVEFIEGDIRDRDQLSEAMAGVDIVFHEAAIVSVEYSVENPEITQAVNARATIQLLELARNEDARVVFASSAAVYGHPESVPISETDSVTSSSPYGLSKLTADQYVQLYAELYNLETVALRYFNVYGPRQTGGDYSGVINVFFEQARNGGSITVHGDGAQTRDFIHVDDIVQANLRAAAHGEPGAVYNIGTGKSITILELAEMIQEIVNDSSVEIDHISPREGDIEQSQANIKRAKTALGFVPTVRLQQGLAELQ